MSSNFLLVGSIITNVISSVGIVLANKHIATAGFGYMTTLTMLHFLSAWVVTELLIYFGVVEKKYVRAGGLIVVVIGCVGSVVAGNFTLAHNSISTFQLSKLLTIPMMLALEYWLYQKKPTLKTLAILTVMLIGVGLTTSLDINLTVVGCLLVVSMVLFTSIGQIATQTTQKKQGLNAMQLLNLTAPLNSLGLLVLIPLFDSLVVSDFVNMLLSESYLGWVSSSSSVSTKSGGSSGSSGGSGSNGSISSASKNYIPVWEFPLTTPLVAWIILSCILSVGVNLTNYYVVGRTSPVTYQVLGHVKNCLVLILGMILFPHPVPGLQIVGILIAISSAIVYSEVRRRDGLQAQQQAQLKAQQQQQSSPPLSQIVILKPDEYYQERSAKRQQQQQQQQQGEIK